MPALTGVTYRTVTGSFRRFTGGASAGTVEFHPSVRVVTTNNDIVLPDPIVATLDSSGDISVSLPVNDDVDMDPTGWTYLVIERVDGEKRSWSFDLPTDDSSPVDLADVAPTDPVSPATSYILASSVEGFATLDDVAAEATARSDADALLIPLAQRAAANGVATLGADSKIPSAQLPSLAIGEVFTVASQAAMLALTAERGDVALRTDLDPDGFFLLTADAPSVLGNWVQITAPGAVISVDGQTGAVSLSGTYALVTEPIAVAETARATAAEATKAPIAEPLAVHLVGNESVAGMKTLTGQARSLTPLLEDQLVKIDPTKVYAVNAAAKLTITTPDASGQVVEPSIYYNPAGWNGHKYWAWITGYTNGDADTENPSIYYSDDGVTFTPVPGAPFPVVAKPAGGNNFDPELVEGPDGRLYGLYCELIDATNVVSLKVVSTADGVTWSAPITLFSSVKTVESVVGSCAYWDGAAGQWVLFYTDIANYWNGINSPHTFKRRTAPTMTAGAFSAATTCTLTNLPAGKGPFEAHIARRGAQLHMVLTTRDTLGSSTTIDRLYFAVSDDDGVTWTMAPTAFLTPSAAGWDNLHVYRGDIVPLDDANQGLYGLWYSAKDSANHWWMGYTTIKLSDAVIVPDAAYNATTWDGSREVPTKNAIRDKLVALTSADLTDFQEAVEDRVGALVGDTSDIDATYNDAGGIESFAIKTDRAADTAITQVASGLTGATAASRYVGATAAGAPTSGTFAVGDFIITQAGRIWICTVAGTPGTWQPLVPGAELDWAMPTSGIAQTFGRSDNVLANISVLTSGTLFLCAIYLRAGQSISTISWVSGTTALSAGSNQWFSLWAGPSPRTKLAVTADDTNTAWAANARKTLTIAGGPYVVPASGFYYLGITVVATTVPSLLGAASAAGASGLTPSLQGNADAGLTNPASAPLSAAGISTVANRPYAHVS